ncbi:MAG TPA: serine/threonine-protein kinase, partial [Gemmataceae bacterium]|nr:serine/threonine-protein kinase [Gemmataceae bacterium]
LRAGRGNELVLGQYVILSLLGQGGMGKVLKARHRLMDRVVALKVIRPNLLAEPRAVSRFHREIKAVSRLSHPNIVAAFDANQVGNTHFLVMEYVEGTDLQRLVKEHGPLPTGLACDCVRQAALGLQHAHEEGLVHRDIKPANLLLHRPPAPGSPVVVKVLDMGLARLHAEEGDGLTHTGAVMGTPDYIAPEQATDAHLVDIRADLYSLGCTLYYLLTGEPPFPGGTAMEKLFKHRYVAPRPVEVRRPELPPAVAAVVAKLMAKRPEARYQTPGELAEALAPLSVVNPEDEATTIFLPKPPAVPEVGSGTIRPSGPAGETMRPDGGATGIEGSAGSSQTSPGDWSASPVPFVEPPSPAGAVPAVKVEREAAPAPAPPRRRPPVLLAGVLVLLGALVVAGALTVPSLLSQLPRERPTGQGTPAEGGNGPTAVATHGGVSTPQETPKTTSPSGHQSPKVDTAGEKPKGTEKGPPKSTEKEPSKPGQVARWQTGEIRRLAPGQRAGRAAFSADGRFGVMSWKDQSTNQLMVYPLADKDKGAGGSPIATGGYEEPEASPAAFSGDGDWLFFGSRAFAQTEGNAETSLRRRYTGDGAGADTGLWDRVRRKSSPQYRFIPWVTCLAISANGKRVIAGTYRGGDDGDSLEGDKACGVYQWDVTGPETATQSKPFSGPERSKKVLSVALSAGGTRAAVSTEGDGVRWWEIVSGTADEPRGKSDPTAGPAPAAVAISPKGDRVLFADKAGLRCREFDPPQRVITFQGASGEATVTSLAFDRDGLWAAAGDDDGNVRLWEVATGQLLSFKNDKNYKTVKHRGKVLAVSITPDRKFVYSAGVDGTIHRWATPAAP